MRRVRSQRGAAFQSRRAGGQGGAHDDYESSLRRPSRVPPERAAGPGGLQTVAMRRLAVAAIVALPLSLAVVSGLPQRAPATALAIAPPGPNSSGDRPPPTTPAPPGPGKVLVRGLSDPVVWLGPSGIYVITPSPGSPDEDTITLVRPTTGNVEAEAQLPGLLVNWSHMVLSAGSLWVTTERPTGRASSTFDLVALGQADLRLRHRLVLAQPAEDGLAAAGGWVWVEGRRSLLKVGPRTGRLGADVALPAPATGDLAGYGDLAGDGAGTVLASVHAGDVLDLLNPSTGAVLGHYQGQQGEGAGIAGIADGQVFTWTGLGQESSYQRFDIADRKFHPVYGRGYDPRLVVSGDRLLYNAYTGYGPVPRPPTTAGWPPRGSPWPPFPTRPRLHGAAPWATPGAPCTT